MCGIVGFNNKKTDTLNEMIKSIEHRGPDDFGTFESNECSLGHVRLSIMDLTTQGHQPMIHENLKIVYNGEVYNFKEIRKELIEVGYKFTSDTDTEVILKAYHHWGIKAVHRFIGMFAIAIYDEESSDLVLIRDRVGVKPLYYYHDNTDFIFASELRPIMKYKNDLKINNDALGEYFKYGYIPSSLSIFENCHKLSAGHYAIYNTKSSKFEVKEYWSILPFFNLPKFQKTEEELIDELEKVLIKSFKYRMVSDVPVGVFLSGGVDSSIVAAILQKHHGNIHTFTIGFKEEKYNEARYAKEVAEHLGTQHTEKILGEKEARKILKNFINIYDEPFADSSGIPTTMVSQVAKDAGIKVVLSADGGDEIFCGYRRYWTIERQWNQILSIPHPLRQMIKTFITPLSKVITYKTIGSKIHTLKELLHYKNGQELYITSMLFFKKLELNSLLSHKSKKDMEISSFDFSMQGMMLRDYHHYMVDDILTKVDRATMSVSIEGREPLLDHHIAEFMAQVPFKYKYKDGTSKYLLKKVLERYIPQKMIDRPKMGFAIPILEWFKHDLNMLVKENINEVRLDEHQLFNKDYIHELYSKNQNNKLLSRTKKLWVILIFQLWYKKYKG